MISIRRRIISSTVGVFVVFWLLASAAVIWIQWNSQNRIYAEQAAYLVNFTASLLRQDDQSIQVEPSIALAKDKYFLLAVKNGGLLYKYNFEILRLNERVLIDPMWYASLEGWIIHDVPLSEQTRLILGIKREDVYGEVAFISLTIALIFIITGVAVLWGILHAIRLGMRPVEGLRDQIDQRSREDLTPLDLESTPDEIKRLVAAMNGLMVRIAEAKKAEQRFLDQAAHELKTPLAGISAQLELLLLDPQLEGVASEIEQIRSSAKRTAQLVNKLLDNARLIQQEEPASLIDFDALVKEETIRCKSAFPEVLIDQVGEGGTLMIPLTSAQLVVANLLENACKYGGSPAKVMIEITPDEDKGITFVIADNGSGLSPEAFELACNPFERLSKASGTGTGLGLSIVRDTINGAGWTMTKKESHPLGGLSIAVRVVKAGL